MNIKDRMSELVKGIFHIKLKDETEFDLKPTEGQKADILMNFKKKQELDAIFNDNLKNNRLTEESIKIHNESTKKLFEEQDEILNKILTRSYDGYKPEEISAIMLRYNHELLMELYFVWEILNRESYEALKKQQQAELKKLSGEVENPEQKPQKKKPEE